MLRIARPSQARASQRSLLSFVTATCLLSASVIPAVAAPTAQATHATQASAAAQASNTAQTAQSAPCLLYTSPSPRDVEESRMPSSA